MTSSGAPIPLPWRSLGGHYCFGCSDENPAGLGLTFYLQGDGLAATLITSRKHESYPGVTHGGIAMAVLDEVMGNALAILEQKLCFTTGIRVRFLAPMLSSRAYCAVARIVERARTAEGLYKVEGEINTDGGQPIAVATASYQWIDTAHAAAMFAPGPEQAALARYLRPSRGETT